MKQSGALLAKGRLLGIQFDTLFTDDLYFLLGRHAIDMSELMKNGLKERGVPFYIDSPTNQQFLLLTNEQAERLKRQVLFSTWERPDEMHTVIRRLPAGQPRKKMCRSCCRYSMRSCNSYAASFQKFLT